MSDGSKIDGGDTTEHAKTSRPVSDRPAAARSALILFAHGSRDPQWAEPFHVIRQNVSRHRPGLSVELAFLEMMRPSLSEAAADLIAAGHTRLTIAPLFMAQGAHVTRDLTQLMETLSARHRGTELVLLPPLGEVEEVLEAISAWLVRRAGSTP